MAANAPTANNLAELYQLAPLDWADVRRTLETNLTQEPGAVRVTDEAQLHRIAQVFAEGGWAPTVADGGFTHEYRPRAPARRPGTCTS